MGTGLSNSLEQVRQFAPLVTDEVRQRSWNQLSYALRADDLWQPARALLLALSPKMEQAGFREEWIAYLSAGIHAAGVQNDFEAIGEFALQIAQLQRMMSDYEPAISWLQTSLENFRKVHDSGGQVRALNELAWVEHLRRHYSEATDAVEQALALLAEDDPERGMCYRVQGMIAIYQRQWQVAEESHRKSLAAFRQQGDERKAAWAMQNLALALRGQKCFDEAIDLFLQAASTMQKVGDLYHWMIVQLNLGTTYYFDNQLNEAVHCYRQAESYAIQFHDRLRLADVYVNLGLVFLA